MKVAVVGAGGFVGTQVANILRKTEGVDQIALVDRAPLPKALYDGGPRVDTYMGDFTDSTIRDAACSGADAVIFLAAILGGAAEADYALARRVNVDATLDLIEHLRDSAPDTRFVFASTVATYAKTLPDPVTDATPLGPTGLRCAKAHDGSGFFEFCRKGVA